MLNAIVDLNSTAENYFKKIHNDNFLCKFDVEVFNCKIDMVMYNKETAELIAVEFKDKNWKRTVDHARCIKYRFNSIYVCVKKPKDQKTTKRITEICKMNDIGLVFSVKEKAKASYSFEEVIRPERVEALDMMLRDQMFNFICEMM